MVFDQFISKYAASFNLSANTTFYSNPSIIFPNTLGQRLRGSSFNAQCWYPIRKKPGLAKAKFHDLRHTQASLMLYAGVDIKIIQQRLGQSGFATTADMYAHLMQDSQAKASDKLSALMSKPSEASEYIF